MITAEQAKHFSHGTKLYSTRWTDAQAIPRKWRVSSAIRTWKRNDNRVLFSVKHGLYHNDKVDFEGFFDDLDANIEHAEWIRHARITVGNFHGPMHRAALDYNNSRRCWEQHHLTNGKNAPAYIGNNTITAHWRLVKDHAVMVLLDDAWSYREEKMPHGAVITVFVGAAFEGQRMAKMPVSGREIPHTLYIKGYRKESAGKKAFELADLLECPLLLCTKNGYSILRG